MTEDDRFKIVKSKQEWTCRQCAKIIPRGSYLFFDVNWIYVRWCINCATNRMIEVQVDNDRTLKNFKKTIRETKKNADKIIKDLSENKGSYEKWNACAELGREVV